MIVVSRVPYHLQSVHGSLICFVREDLRDRLQVRHDPNPLFRDSGFRARNETRPGRRFEQLAVGVDIRQLVNNSRHQLLPVILTIAVRMVWGKHARHVEAGRRFKRRCNLRPRVIVVTGCKRLDLRRPPRGVELASTPQDRGNLFFSCELAVLVGFC